MRSFVVFKVLDRLYGIDIECVKRILPSQQLTAMPDEEDHIEGMFQYEDEIIKVLSFRKAIGEDTYEVYLKKNVFAKLEDEIKTWLDTLSQSVDKGIDSSLSTNPHNSCLGKWLDSFHPDDSAVIEAMSVLVLNYQNLYKYAGEILEYKDKDPEKAKQAMNEDIASAYKETLAGLKRLSKLADKVSANLQRCFILIGQDGEVFGVNIDEVDDIIHVEEGQLHEALGAQSMGDFMDVSAILEHDEKLITIVKNVSIEKRSA